MRNFKLPNGRTMQFDRNRIDTFGRCKLSQLLGSCFLILAMGSVFFILVQPKNFWLKSYFKIQFAWKYVRYQFSFNFRAVTFFNIFAGYKLLELQTSLQPVIIKWQTFNFINFSKIFTFLIAHRFHTAQFSDVEARLNWWLDLNFWY